MKIGISIGLIVLAVLLVLIVTSTFRGPRYRVQVCMYYNAKMNCRNVAGRSEQAALRSGIQNACADIASGVEEVMGCESSAPRSVKWLSTPGR